MRRTRAAPQGRCRRREGRSRDRLCREAYASRPRRPKRFDTRFFTADATSVAHKIEGVIGPDSELVELAWTPIEQAAQLDMPTITGVILEELLARVEAGMAHALSVPFYFMQDGRFNRELL